MPQAAYDCIVLGAGVAGLAAARAPGREGRRVLVLEARSRVGGRLLTEQVDGQPVELGAEFVHGRPPELLALLDEAGLELREVAPTRSCAEDGAVRPCPEDEGFWPLLETMGEAASRGDLSFNAWLAQSDAPEAVKAEARRYVEGFNAADAGEIGIVGLERQQAAEDAIEGERAARVTAGYARLAEYLARGAVAAGVEIRLESPAAVVAWQPGRCRVALAGGERLEATQVLCTVPVGVLQAGSLRFEPEPERALRAARSLSAGMVQRAVLEFRDAWWRERAPGLSWLFARGMPLPVWWTTGEPGRPLLTAWTGGPNALRFTDRDALESAAMETLRRVFAGVPADGPVAMHHHDWMRDPWTRGAYSSVPAGAAAAPAELADPVEDTLFFAGEHTDTTGHPGTVHGALRSGLRAAAQMRTARERRAENRSR